MEIAFEKPTRHREVLNASVTSISLFLSGILSYATGNPIAYGRFAAGSIGKIKSIVEDLKGRDTSSPENLAWVWFTMTVSGATEEFLKQLNREANFNSQLPIRTGRTVAEREIGLKKFLEKALSVPSDANFDASILQFPSAHAAFSPARQAIPQFIVDVTPWIDIDLERWQHVFDTCLANTASYVLSAHFSIFEPLIKIATSTFSEAAAWEIAWARHGEWIHQRFRAAPVFSPDESVLTPLSEIYLRLRCYWHETDQEFPNEKSKKTVIKCEANLGDLHRTVEEWLGRKTKGRDVIRIVAGGPGSGKSSFAKAFASELLDRGIARVLFIELQHLSFSGDLHLDIGSYLSRSNRLTGDEGSPGFAANPLDRLKDDTKPTLIIFDGLDELTHDAEKAGDLARKFIASALQLLVMQNQGGDKIRGLILGRNLAAQEGMKEAGLSLVTLLNVAPIRDLSNDDLRPHMRADNWHHLEVIYPDLSKELTKDQRPDYWRRWAISQGMDPNVQPEAITHEDLSDLNVEPLLLHLLILSDYCGDRWQEAADNRNLVYEDILRKVRQRNELKALGAATPRESDFFLLMECLGLSAWRGNVRAGDEETYNEIRRLHAKSLEKVAATDLESVLLLTHTRQIEGSMRGFEFIHKSFGEYLAARGMLTQAELAATRMTRDEDPFDEERVASMWAQVINDAELSRELIRFLRDQIRLLCQNSHAAAEKLKECLEKLVNWIHTNGVSLVPETRETFRHLETRQRCAEASLFALTSILSETLITLHQGDINEDYLQSRRVKVDWSMGEAAVMFHRIGVTVGHPAKRALAALDISSEELEHVNLVNSIMPYSNFGDAKLSGANLSHAILVRANFRETMAGESDFSSAAINFGEFQESSFVGCNFSSADVRMANFENANLNRSDFRDVNLEGASFAGVAARLTDFTGCTSMTQKQLNHMFGVKEGAGRTEIPDHLEYPDFWHTEAERGRKALALWDDFFAAYHEWLGPKAE
ncbi:hypothetical protein EOI86_18725 [Hwanghaeella grinnelliae]|uniref:NACHT domain-containing protein n=1 Tax=Hwanghaeella grinnelliae TaxID=2500179 RepID=A0A437QK34_9PROT|nr:pentapeptide repeat-containing protein [Hwanghaeella grinnelliae]RVU34874.1 hypothetical protein EOI86_18725 [Hwanghaeella grinnelliae]